ncbi:hypothetical protein GE061_003737 [Apolygus lucorum]|uniref:Uncharacterized protein n=1 Tax=Apolygus lucorum TaxID=248454 RepID=A0A8S9X4B7_APOLU|nr:hypothetical protein GE061_003737 [Apolygus lucorum]
MLTLIFLSLAAVAQGQYPYPPAAPYPPAVRVAQPTVIAAPVAIQSGGLHSTHFRPGPYPPAETLTLEPASSGPYPPAQPVLLAPVSSGPYPPALPTLEGGDISPVEDDSPRIAHTTYSLPHTVPGSLQSTASSYPLQPEHLGRVPASHPIQPHISSPFPSNPSHPGQSPSFETPNYIPGSPQPFQSGGEVSPEELEIPPNTQIKLQDKRLQYSHGFSDDKGTAVREQGSLLTTNDGWEYVESLRTTIEGVELSTAESLGIPMKM